MERRTLLAAVGGAARMGASPPAAAFDGPRVGIETIADLRSGLASLYGLDDRFGGATVGPLAAHLSRIQRLIDTGSYPETIGRQLRLISGETAKHVGWLAFDAGDHARARRYWTQARDYATELRDDSLAVLTGSTTPVGPPPSPHRGHPRPSCPSPPPARRGRWPCSATPSARTTLASAARLYEQDRGSRPAPDWTLFHGPSELAAAQAELFTAAGHHKAAVTWLRRSLERQEVTYARNEVLHRGRLAGALARSGEADEAAHHIHQGEALLTEVSSGRAREGLAVARRELDLIHRARRGDPWTTS
ncbi:hypothetical protein [Streptomyces sp. 3211]|uniref:hypothetical protein n=1 Tax=Streptomyces sp. 3211 TaxID=1964449 RepID=UPI0009A54D86|nr:hypothetical protein [Streptomyces sp. 3211]